MATVVFLEFSEGVARSLLAAARVGAEGADPQIAADTEIAADMIEHALAARTETGDLRYGVCLGGALVPEGEHDSGADALRHGVDRYRTEQWGGAAEPVQILVWPRGA